MTDTKEKIDALRKTVDPEKYTLIYLCSLLKKKKTRQKNETDRNRGRELWLM